MTELLLRPFQLRISSLCHRVPSSFRSSGPRLSLESSRRLYFDFDRPIRRLSHPENPVDAPCEFGDRLLGVFGVLKAKIPDAVSRSETRNPLQDRTDPARRRSLEQRGERSNDQVTGVRPRDLPFDQLREGDYELFERCWRWGKDRRRTAVYRGHILVFGDRIDDSDGWPSRPVADVVVRRHRLICTMRRRDDERGVISTAEVTKRVKAECILGRIYRPCDEYRLAGAHCIENGCERAITESGWRWWRVVHAIVVNHCACGNSLSLATRESVPSG